MVDFEYKPRYGVYDLKNIVRLLRGEGGCPWDREQTHESIRRNFLEEAYEAVEAIDEGSSEHLKEELGDVLLQVALHSQMEEEAGAFDLDGVADGVCKKLILRHPHVFGDTHVDNTDQVLQNWDAIKRVEKSQETTADAMEAVAKSLPSLWRAEKVQKKAAKAGFDWPEISGVVDKLYEELGELREAIRLGTGQAGELGDLLFTAVNLSRFLHVDCEDALNGSTDKFISRFKLLEKAASDNGGMENLTLEKLDKLYDQAKETLFREQD